MRCLGLSPSASNGFEDSCGYPRFPLVVTVPDVAIVLGLAFLPGGRIWYAAPDGASMALFKHNDPVQRSVL